MLDTACAGMHYSLSASPLAKCRIDGNGINGVLFAGWRLLTFHVPMRAKVANTAKDCAAHRGNRLRDSFAGWGVPSCSALFDPTLKNSPGINASGRLLLID